MAAKRRTLTGQVASIRSLALAAPNRLELADRVREGLPSSAVLALERATGMSRSAIFAAARIPSRTGARQFKDGRFGDHESERLARLARIVDRAEDLMGSVAEGALWLQKPQIDFGGRRPLDVAATEIGAGEVESLISRIEDGVF